MRIFSFILISFLLSCSNKKTDKRENITCNDSINYEIIKQSNEYQDLSEFILKNPYSEYFFDVIELYHKIRMAYMDSIGMPYFDCFRNCARIELKPNQDLVYEHEIINLNFLKDSLLNFLVNENDSPLLPEKIIIEDNIGVPHEISVGRIELQFVIDSCEIIQDVVNEISKSINAYKDYLSQNWYSKELTEIDLEEKCLIDSLLKNRLILYRFDREYILPLPPPDDYKYDY